MTKRIGVMVVFLVGCAVGGASSQLVVPRASAQQAAALPKWEYACTQPGSLDELVADAKAHGQQSWEMVGLSNAIVCFKRPKM